MSKLTDSSTKNRLLSYLSEGFCSNCKETLEIRIDKIFIKNPGLLDDVVLPGGHKSNLSRALCFAHSSREKSSAPSSSAVHTSKAPVASSVYLEYGRSEGVSAQERNLISQSVEWKRMAEVGTKKDFVSIEDIDGKQINVLDGLEMHTRVFNYEEQKKIVTYVDSLLRMHQSGKLKAHTYRRRRIHGKERATLEFGCCYVVDKNGIPRDVAGAVDAVPYELKLMIKKMVKWHILPPNCIPNNCIVRVYEEGDYISPQYDHHYFVWPFCTVSFLTGSNILFGSKLKVEAPGEFSGAEPITVPAGSVLILKGNVADVAQHCVPATLGKRITITFRKMDDSELPFKFLPDADLQNIMPLARSQVNSLQVAPPSASNIFQRPKSKTSGGITPFFRQR